MRMTHRPTDVGRRAVLATVAALLVIVATTSACSTRGRDTSGSRPERGTTVVEVDNGNFADVTVYALSTGQYYRLGEVSGHGRATLRLPRQLDTVRDLRLVADPIGSRVSYFSDAVLFEPGDRLVLSVGPTMNLSTVSVRAGRTGPDD